MLREFEWSTTAKNCLRLSGLTAFDVEEAVRLSHHSRKRNEGPADWIIRRELDEGLGTLFARYDWPSTRKGEVRDEARARLVSFWVMK
jgi:hypothetical protein